MPSIFQAQALRLLLKSYTVDFFLSYLVLSRFLQAAPELIVEIAASTASYDLHDKLRAYRRNGVKEYLVWLVESAEFRWYILKNSEYLLQTPDAAGLLTSQTFPGLTLDVPALLRDDMAQVLASLG
jgi:Uma2 family endonuclease